jgi:hypothetical protein
MIKLGRIPLNELSARRRDLYLTTYNTHKRHIHVPGGIRTRNLRIRTATGPRLRPRGHWDRQNSMKGAVTGKVMWLSNGKIIWSPKEVVCTEDFWNVKQKKVASDRKLVTLPHNLINWYIYIYMYIYVYILHWPIRNTRCVIAKGKRIFWRNEKHKQFSTHKQL